MATKRKPRFIGNLYRICLEDIFVYALCIARDETWGYLLKWFERSVDPSTLDPLAEPEFMYGLYNLGAASRLKELEKISTHDIPEGSVPHFYFADAVVKKPTLIYPDNTWELVEWDDPRLVGLSAKTLYPRPIMREMYLEGRSSAEDFRRLRVYLGK